MHNEQCYAIYNYWTRSGNPVFSFVCFFSCHDSVRLMKIQQRLALLVMYVAHDDRDGRGYVYDPFNWCYRGSCSHFQMSSRTHYYMSIFLLWKINIFFMSAVNPETTMPNKSVSHFTCFIFVFVLYFVCVCFCFVLNYRVKAAILVGSVSSRNALHIIIYHIL